MGPSLWFGAVSSQRAFAGVVVSVRDEGTPSLPPLAPNSILALEDVLFVASPLMLDFAGTGVMEESVAATVAALPRCDDGCGIAQRGLCPPCFQYVGCGLFSLGSDLPLVAATDFAFLVSFVGLSRVTDFLGSVVFAGLLELGTGLFISMSCERKQNENAKVQESCLKAVFGSPPQATREGAAARTATAGFSPSAAACRMPAAESLGLASMVENEVPSSSCVRGYYHIFLGARNPVCRCLSPLGSSRRGCSLHCENRVPPCGSCMSDVCSRVLGSGLLCRRDPSSSCVRRHSHILMGARIPVCQCLF